MLPVGPRNYGPGMALACRWRRLAAAVGGRVVVRVRSGVARGARWTAYPWSSYWRGGHEPEIQRALMGWAGEARPSPVCWDLGAHYGLYSVGLSMRWAGTGRVVAFEPNPVSFARLSRHRELNGLRNLLVFPVAASDRTGENLLFTYGNLDSTTTHLRYDGEQGVGGQPISVPTVRLDDWVDSARIPPPNLIKVDVEGHGHRALAGAEKSIARMKPVLMVAFHSREEELGVEALLGPLGYTRECICQRDYLYRPGSGGPVQTREPAGPS